ncbi:MAG: adenylate/guanylate cyclase domain-containing protein [Gallionella sp.]
MSGNQETLAVLFADISGSSDLYERLGDKQAQRSIAQCIRIMTGVLPDYQGTLIKTVGDEVMCIFPTAELAFHASCAMQSAVEKARYQDADPMHIRIGFHYGEVIRDSGDVYGDTVNLAARVSATTRTSQIMVTQAVVDILPPDLQEKTSKLVRAGPKGKPAPFDIFLVTWLPDNKQLPRHGTPAQRKPKDEN